MNLKQFMNHKFLRYIIILAFFYYLPVILILLGIVPFSFRFQMLLIVTALLAVYSAIHGNNLRSLGFRTDTLKISLLWNGALSALFVGILMFLYYKGLIREPSVPSWRFFYFFFIFISSPSQEFLYRSIHFAEMKEAGIKSPIAMIGISAITYCFLHAIYHDLITLIATLFMGIIWGTIYYRKPNFWGVALSHAVVGAIAIAVGLI